MVYAISTSNVGNLNVNGWINQTNSSLQNVFAGNVSVSGGSYYIGDGSKLTGITAEYNETKVNTSIDNRVTAPFLQNLLDSVYVQLSDIVSLVGNFSAWDKSYSGLIDTPTHLTNFTDDLGDRGYTHLSNFTDDVVTGVYALITYVDSLGNWSADKSSYSIWTDIKSYIDSLGNYSAWDKDYGDLINSPTHLSNFTDDVVTGNYALIAYVDTLGNFSDWDKDYADLINNPTYLSNFTDDLGNRGYTHLSNFTDDVVTGNYALITYVDTLGNWSADKASYALTTYVDSIGNYSAWDKDYNDLINTPTHLSNLTDDLGDRGYGNATAVNESLSEYFKLSETGYNIIVENISATYLNGNSSWQHQDYPSACSANYFVTEIGDANICTQATFTGLVGYPTHLTNFTNDLNLDNVSITSLNDNITALRTDIDNNVTVLRTDIDNNITAVRTDIDNNATAIRLDIDNNITVVRLDIDNNITSVKSILRTDIDNNITAVRLDIDNNITQVYLDLRVDIDNNVTVLRTDIDNNITAVRTDITNNITSVKSLLRTDLQNNITAVRLDIDNNATKIYLDLRIDIDNNVTALRADIDNNITVVRTDITNNITEVKTDITNNITALRVDIDNNVTALRTDIDNNITMVRTDITNNISSITSNYYNSTKSNATYLKIDGTNNMEANLNMSSYNLTNTTAIEFVNGIKMESNTTHLFIDTGSGNGLFIRVS